MTFIVIIIFINQLMTQRVSQNKLKNLNFGNNETALMTCQEDIAVAI